MRTRAPVTLQTVADSLGLSRSTVSLALRDAPVIAEATRIRVHAEAARLGFVPNRNAIRLRTQQRNIVGLVVPDITNPVVAEAAIGMQQSLEAERLIVLLSNTFDDLEIQRRVLRQLVEEQVAGVLLLAALRTTPLDLAPLIDASIPIVLFNREVAGADIPIVRVADDVAVQIAFEHLTAVHRTRSVGYFGGIADAGPRIGRMSSFEAMCRDAGVHAVSEWSAPTLSSAISARDTARALFASGARLPEGLIVHNDIIAVGVLRAMHEHGIESERLRIVSIDDVELASIVSPSLTSVSIHARSLAAAAGRALISTLSGVDVDSALPRPTLSVRESCGCTTG